MVKQLPGFRSEARATEQPESIIFLAGAKGSFKQKAVAGSSVLMTPASAIWWIPSSEAFKRWSAEYAPVRAASSAPPREFISSAWTFSLKPISFALVR